MFRFDMRDKHKTKHWVADGKLDERAIFQLQKTSTKDSNSRNIDRVEAYLNIKNVQYFIGKRCLLVTRNVSI